LIITKYGEFTVTASTFSDKVVNINLLEDTEYTILYARIFTSSNSATDKFILGCGTSATDANVTDILTLDGRSYSGTATSTRVTDVFGKLKCDSDLWAFNTVANSSEYHYQVTYVPYNTDNQPRDINYADFLYVSLVIIFILSFIGLGFLSSAFKPKE